MLNEKQIKLAIDSKIRCLVQHDSEKYSKGDSVKVYRRVLESEIYDFIINVDSRLYLESIEYVFAAYDLEVEKGENSMIEFISRD